MNTARPVGVFYRRISQVSFFVVLVACAALTLRTGLKTPDGGGNIAQQSSALQGNHDESVLPDLLELTVDPANPEQVQLRILQSIEGLARLVVESDTPVQWMTPRPQGVMTLKRRGAPQEFTLNVSAAKQMKSSLLKVALIFEDDQGQAYMHVSRELDLKGPKAASTLSLPQPEGLSAGGRAVLARTPLDAPVPVTLGGLK